MNTVRPGNTVKCTLTPSDPDDVKACCGGSFVESTYSGTGPSYDFEVDGAFVTCPGPVEFKENGNVLKKVTVAPCP